MKLARLICLAFLGAILIGFATDSSAKAQCGDNQGFPNPGWFGYRSSPYSLGLIPVPPYFSLHPPVYYSMPVPRTYGYSPYAYPGHVRTPEVEMAEVIENPHVEAKPAIKPAIDNGLKTASYKIIDNPFVRSELKSKLSTQYAAFERK
ncbi:MAG: hypothetical protein P8N76_01460 [Pirellulaceae bacterium]|nr:hypothetical protein [Pirellulaceae bacterium]